MTGPSAQSSLPRAAGLLGGLCWLAQAVLDAAGGPVALVDGLHWGGLALVVIGLLGLGAGLVSGLPALRVVVAVCLTVLVLSLREVGHEQWPDATVDGTLGALLALWCAVGLARQARRRRAQRFEDRRDGRDSRRRREQAQRRRTTESAPVPAAEPAAPPTSRRAPRERRSGSHAA